MDPLHVRTETRLAGEIDGDVQTEPAFARYGIDEPAERRATAQHEIVALGEIARRNLVPREALQIACDVRCKQPGRVDPGPTVEPHREGAADPARNGIILHRAAGCRPVKGRTEERSEGKEW